MKENWFLKIIDKDRTIRISKKLENEIKELSFFYIIQSPSQSGPKDSLKFINYGLKYSCHFSEFKQRMKKNINISDSNYIYENKGKFKDLSDIIIKEYNSRNKPVIIFSKGEYGEIDTLFIRIRNAIAHKNFLKKNDYYVLWNEKNDDINCFFKLKFDHLITIFQTLKTFKD